jgi:hypothetical protein
MMGEGFFKKKSYPTAIYFIYPAAAAPGRPG